jgi:serine/threonine protein kinase/basic membrane lipoprotein Med (substrate-binding protein (PBP1-ABC) superfamily)
MIDLIGKDIGRYHIVEQLGQGGMATVYKAFDTRLEREVAIKFIRREAISEEALSLMLKRFEREAKALARLSHPNIVKVHDFGEYEGSPYLVMEFIKGGTLKELKRDTIVPWDQAARLLTPIARALHYAHQNNIVHRDIKPSNILITASGEPMLSDFGIAKILDAQEHTQLTSTGTGVGTPDYMAPEQWMGGVVPQTDIYALGIVFYEMVTGKLPFRADTPAAVLIKHVSDPLPRPRSFNPDLPDAVEWVLYKALAKKPEDRYEDMSIFASALERLGQGITQEMGVSQQTSAATPSAGIPLPVPPAPTQAVTASAPQPAMPETLVASSRPVYSASDAVTTASIPAASLPQAAKPTSAPRKGNPLWLILGALAILGFLGVAAVFTITILLKPGQAVSQVQPTQEIAVPTAAPTRTATRTAAPTQTTAPTPTAAPIQTASQAPTLVQGGTVDFLACMTTIGDPDVLDFNTMAWQGLLQAERDFGISISFLSGNSEEEVAAHIDTFASRGCDMIVTTGFNYANITEEAARTYPAIKFVGIDMVPGADQPNFAYVQYHEDQAGFLMGALAAMMTQTNQVVAVCGPDYVAAVWRFCEGYRAGAHYVDGAVFVEINYYTGDLSTAFYDDAWYRDMGSVYYSKGFDALFTVAGTAGDSALTAFAEADDGSHPVYGMGVDFDKYLILQQARPVLLSSAIKQMDQSVYDLVQAALQGTFQGGLFYGNVGYAPFHDLDLSVPDDVRLKLADFEASLNNGTLNTGVPEVKP